MNEEIAHQIVEAFIQLDTAFRAAGLKTPVFVTLTDINEIRSLEWLLCNSRMYPSTPKSRATVGQMEIAGIKVVAPQTAKVPHEWEPSPYGHGNKRCKHCLATDLEISAIGDLDHCPDRAAKGERP